MFPNRRSSHRPRMRPSLETLEERALLDAALPHVKHLASRAEVSAAKPSKAPIATNLPSAPTSSSTTVPANGDVNPYGLAVVPAGFPRGGLLRPGDFLVSNFNNKTNTPGTGKTIVAITPGQNAATAPVFFTSQADGLTQSLSVLRSGFVIVGNVPTTDGTSDTIGPGSLQIINRFGAVVQTLSDASTGSNLFDGPWAGAVNDKGNTAQLFVSNVESGTITRIDFKVVKKHGQANLKVVSMKQIASGYTVTTATGNVPAGNVYVQTNLVSNGTVPAQQTDANLQDPWGLSFATTGPFWISDQAANFGGSAATTVYSVSSTQPPTSSGVQLVVGVANQGNAAPSSANGPTGQVSPTAPGITTSSTTDFQLNGAQASFIFANLDGSISAWNGGASSTIEATVAGASFTGLAIANTSTGAAQLYAADQNSGKIDVFNSNWQMTGSFTDPNFSTFPSGYAAFNVQMLVLNGKQTLFVTYANQSTSGGIVDEFTTDGTFIKTLIDDTAGQHLNSPWGLTIAPASWGQFGGDLLVGNNNGPGEINAYSQSGAFQGTLTLNTGQPFAAADLWALSFGNGSDAGSQNTLFFTAGLASNTDGLFGAISAQSVPEPSTAAPNSGPLILGPGGLAYNSKNDTLYVAATGNNEIFAIKHASKTHSDAGTGALVYHDQAHLRGPIGLALAPNGDLLTTNDDAVNVDANQPSELIEFTPEGQFVGELSLDNALGAAFQILVQSTRKTVTVASVNDDLATLDFRTNLIDKP
jgi:uncharacterized protein (TIGR03118 family)